MSGAGCVPLCSSGSSMREMVRAAMASAIFAPGVLDGHVALVTGGGTGLGKAAARELLACGARGLICGRRAEVLGARGGGAGEELGEGCAWVAGHVRDEEGCARIVDAALSRLGALNTVVNNAGGQYF